MNNRELDKILTRAPVPERPVEFWNEFSNRMSARIRTAARPAPVDSTAASPVSAWLWRAAFAGGLALLCVYLAIAFGVRHRPAVEDPQLATARKYLREIQALFPNQVQSIEFDASGTRLKLADHPDVPNSPPLYVSVCGPHGCRQFVTFSGQQIRVGGEVFDVLLDRQGAVLVVGKQWVWPDPNRAGPAPYRVEARPLPMTS